jgi:hypothetical protein
LVILPCEVIGNEENARVGHRQAPSAVAWPTTFAACTNNRNGAINVASITERLTAQWPNAANFLLAVWLMVSPWVLGYADHSAAAWNAFVMGFVIALAAASAVIGPRLAEEWVTAVLAAWLLVSPYVLGFSAMHAASLNSFGVGVLVVALALWAALAGRSTDGAASKG